MLNRKKSKKKKTQRKEIYLTDLIFFFRNKLEFNLKRFTTTKLNRKKKKTYAMRKLETIFDAK